MGTRKVVVTVPEKIFLAEKTDEAALGWELRTLAAVKLYELGRLSSGRAAELAGAVVFELQEARQKGYAVPNPGDYKWIRG